MAVVIEAMRDPQLLLGWSRALNDEHVTFEEYVRREEVSDASQRDPRGLRVRSRDVHQPDAQTVK